MPPGLHVTVPAKFVGQLGYQGQRYEVRALRPKGDAIGGASTEPFVVGWTDQEDGGSLVKMVERHPSWHSAKVVDLGENEVFREAGQLDRLPVTREVDQW